MSNNHRNYAVARQQLISFLQSQGFKPHPNEVFCPAEHCWVDVAALKGQDYWAFEYKSRNDSIKRGLEQCCSYAKAFNYVVLVADRHRATSSPYFGQFKRNGFGVWSHTMKGFYPLLNPKRQGVLRKAAVVVERQFRWALPNMKTIPDSRITDWLVRQPPLRPASCKLREAHVLEELGAGRGIRSSTRLSG